MSSTHCDHLKCWIWLILVWGLLLLRIWERFWAITIRTSEKTWVFWMDWRHPRRQRWISLRKWAKHIRLKGWKMWLKKWLNGGVATLASDEMCLASIVGRARKRRSLIDRARVAVGARWLLGRGSSVKRPDKERACRRKVGEIGMRFERDRMRRS